MNSFFVKLSILLLATSAHSFPSVKGILPMFFSYCYMQLNLHKYCFVFIEAGSVVYVHDWKTVDLVDETFGQLLLETQSDRILYIEI